MILHQGWRGLLQVRGMRSKLIYIARASHSPRAGPCVRARVHLCVRVPGRLVQVSKSNTLAERNRRLFVRG